MNNDYEKMRAQLWCDVCVACASNLGAKVSSLEAIDLADTFVEDFDDRFKPRMYDQMNCAPQVGKETHGR